MEFLLEKSPPQWFESSLFHLQNENTRSKSGCMAVFMVDIANNGYSWYKRSIVFDTVNSETLLASAEEACAFLKEERILSSIDDMRYFVKNNNEHLLAEQDYGFKIYSKEYVFYIRLNPKRGERNMDMFIFRKEPLEKYLLKVSKGISILNSAYEKIFTIPDGGRVRIVEPDGSTTNTTVHYEDEDTVFFGGVKITLNKLADLLAQKGATIVPLNRPPTT